MTNCLASTLYNNCCSDTENMHKSKDFDFKYGSIRFERKSMICSISL